MTETEVFVCLPRTIHPDREGSARLCGSGSEQPEPAGGQRAHPAHQRAPGKEQQGQRVQVHPPPLTLGRVAQAQRPGPHPAPPQPPQQEQERPQERPSAGAQQ